MCRITASHGYMARWKHTPRFSGGEHFATLPSRPPHLAPASGCPLEFSSSTVMSSLNTRDGIEYSSKSAGKSTVLQFFPFLWNTAKSQDNLPRPAWKGRPTGKLFPAARLMAFGQESRFPSFSRRFLQATVRTGFRPD